MYGAYLSYWILKPYINAEIISSPAWGDYLSELGDGLIEAVDVGGLSIAGVGLLAASTAALPLALFAYHCYLIWAGMTTNETQKWADWRDDIADGGVFKTTRDALLNHTPPNNANGSASKGLAEDLGVTADEPQAIWPICSTQVIVRTNDGRPPHGQEALWTQIWGLSDVDNLYDLGGWDNLMEILNGR